MSNIFDIEQKKDTAERLAAVVGIPSKNVLFAGEFNEVKRIALEAAVENVNIDFSWGYSNPIGLEQPIPGEVRIQNLRADFQAPWMFAAVDEVTLLIDRYRPKRIVRTKSREDAVVRTKNSGFYHAKSPDIANPNRPSEIALTQQKMDLNFGQEYYFKETGAGYRALGFGKRNIGLNTCFVVLRFRIRIKKGSYIYESATKGTIEMGYYYSPLGIKFYYKLK